MHDELFNIIMLMIPEIYYILLLQVSKKWYAIIKKYINTHTNYKFILKQSIIDGYLSICSWLTNSKYDLDLRTIKFAAIYDHLEILKWAINTGCDWNIKLCFYAELYGNFEILQWAKKMDIIGILIYVLMQHYMEI